LWTRAAAELNLSTATVAGLRTGMVSSHAMEVVQWQRCLLHTLLEVGSNPVSAWVSGRPLRARAYALWLAQAQRLPDPVTSSLTVTEWLRHGHQAIAPTPVVVDGAWIAAAAAADVSPKMQWLRACHVVGDGDDHDAVVALLAAVPPALGAWVAVVHYEAVHAEPPLPWELGALIDALAAAPAPPTAADDAALAPAAAIQTVARWRATLVSVGLLAQALGLTAEQGADPGVAVPLAAATMAIEDAQLFASLERARRGGTSPAASTSAFRDAVAPALARVRARIPPPSPAPAAAPAPSAPPRAAKAPKLAPARRPATATANAFSVLADGVDF
jgi:hypothetical protein